MKKLIYTSASSHMLTDQELIEILVVARNNNHRLGITGILLYVEGVFFQVLEGPEQEIDYIYNRISQDKRHRRISMVISEPIEHRDFPEWKMGFVTLEPPRDHSGYSMIFEDQTSVPLTSLSLTTQIALDEFIKQQSRYFARKR